MARARELQRPRESENRCASLTSLRLVAKEHSSAGIDCAPPLTSFFTRLTSSHFSPRNLLFGSRLDRPRPIVASQRTSRRSLRRPPPHLSLRRLRLRVLCGRRDRDCGCERTVQKRQSRPTTRRQRRRCRLLLLASSHCPSAGSSTLQSTMRHKQPCLRSNG